MEILTSSYCTPLTAAARMRLQGAAGVTTARLLLLGSGIVSGRVAAVLPVGGAASSARTTRFAAGGQGSPTSELLTVATFATLVYELEFWLTNPPECKEDFKKIEITAGKCVNLFPRLVHDSSLVPKDILEDITNINVSIFGKLHNQSRGEDPKADANAIEEAIRGVERMSKILSRGLRVLQVLRDHQHEHQHECETSQT